MGGTAAAPEAVKVPPPGNRLLRRPCLKAQRAILTLKAQTTIVTRVSTFIQTVWMSPTVQFKLCHPSLCLLSLCLLSRWQLYGKMVLFIVFEYIPARENCVTVFSSLLSLSSSLPS